MGTPTGRPDLVTFEPKNYRDVHWCPVLNEPAIIVYPGGKPECPICGVDPSDGHPFLCHIAANATLAYRRPESPAVNRQPVVIATTGAYSDYRVVAILEWLTEKTPDACKSEFLEVFPEMRKDCAFESYRFVGWLAQKGYAQDMEALEMHTDTYGRVDDFKCEAFEREMEWRKAPSR